MDTVFVFQATYEDLGITQMTSLRHRQFLDECSAELNGIECLNVEPWAMGSPQLNVTVRGQPATILNRKSEILKECLDLPSFPEICLAGMADDGNDANVSDSNSNKDAFVIYIVIVLGAIVCLLCAVIAYYHHLYVQGVNTAMDSIVTFPIKSDIL